MRTSNHQNNYFLSIGCIVLRHFMLFLFSIACFVSAQAAPWSQVTTSDGVKEYPSDEASVVVEYSVFHPLANQVLESMTVFGDGRVIRDVSKAYRNAGRYQNQLTELELNQLMIGLGSPAIRSVASDYRDPETELIYTDQPQVTLKVLLVNPGATEQQKASFSPQSASGLDINRTVEFMDIFVKEHQWVPSL